MVHPPYRFTHSISAATIPATIGNSPRHEERGPILMRAPRTIGIQADAALTDHPSLSSATGKPLKPQGAESRGHQPFVAESSSPVSSISAMNRSASRQPTCRAQRQKALSLVTFFMPSKESHPAAGRDRRPCPERVPLGAGDDDQLRTQRISSI
jgi:hypothetical protein